MFFDKNIYSGKIPVVTELAERDYLYGKIKVPETTVGALYYYTGNKLELNVTAIGTDGNPIEDTYVVVTISSPSEYPDNLCSNGQVWAKVDGNTYDLRTEPLIDQYGNPFTRESIFISDTIQYNLEYALYKKVSDDRYDRITDKEAIVEVEVSTYTFAT